jgi:tetratricopeptide (TPR) repeat protein
LGVAYQALGAYTEGIDCLTRNAVVLEGDLSCESNDMRVTSPLAVTSLAVTSRAQLARCLAEIGAFAEGIAYGEAAVQLAETLNRPYDLVSASLGIGHLYLRKGDYDRAIRVLERGLDVCRAWDVWLLFPWVASALGGAYALSDRVTDGLSLLEQAVGQAASMRFMVLQASRLAMLSEATLIAGHSAKALAFATQALTLARDHQERGTQAWALRLLGQVASHRDPPEVEQAKAYYLQAMALAEELGMRPLQAHCHVGLGALYARTGQREQAHAELSVAIERYHAMEMTFWLARAEAALAEVEGY